MAPPLRYEALGLKLSNVVCNTSVLLLVMLNAMAVELQMIES